MWVELGVLKSEVTITHLAEVDEVFNEGVNETKLAHHDAVVVLSLSIVFSCAIIRHQDAHDLLKKEYHTEEGRSHLMTNHRSKTLSLLRLEILLLSLHIEELCLNLLCHFAYM